MRSLKKALGLPVKFRCGELEFSFPSDHMLPTYQKTFPFYDRFLPHLARYLSAGTSVIDVGANCGDTVAAMYSANRELRYFCIEPDPGFVTFLKKNVGVIRTNSSRADIAIIESLIGCQTGRAALVGTGGTKHAATAANGIPYTTLDSLVSKHAITNVSLLKSDVDGFDYDVLNSAASLVARDRPLIFFECQYDEVEQKEAYKACISSLFSCRYDHWVVFDNFGRVLLETSDTSVLFSLLEYVWRQRNEKHKSIYYYDFLCFPADRTDFIKTVLDNYVAR